MNKFNNILRNYYME